MFKRERKIQKIERLNIIPIMDAIFIFIFFLLFSAQFIKLFEIETSSPVVSEVPLEMKPDKKPLNLIVKIYKEKIEFLTGIDQNLEQTFLKHDLDYIESMKEKLMELRKSYPDENHATISPLLSIAYNEIIKVIDIVQTIPEDKKLTIIKDGKEKNLKKIFSKVVLSPIESLSQDGKNEI